jgi:hypothetical protein
MTGFIKRTDVKILPLPFLLTFAYGMYSNGASTLIALALNMYSWFNLNVTAQALSLRLSKIESVKFLKQILIEAMNRHVKTGFSNKYAELLKFPSVKIEDSTQFKLHEEIKEFRGSGGSASSSAMKINTVYDINKHAVSELDIVSGATSDQALSKNVRKRITKGELRIRDLGFFNIVDMICINEAMAYFLSSSSR